MAVYDQNTFYIQLFDMFFFDSGIDFKDAGGPPMLTGPLPDPKPPKIDLSPGGEGVVLATPY